MGLVSLDLLKPGMVLASELRSRQGRALLPGGAELTEKHIRTLKIWGVNAADIHGEGDEDEKERSLTPEELDTVKPYVQANFRFNNLSAPLVRSMARLNAQRICRANRTLAPFESPPETPSNGRSYDLDPAALAEKNAELASLPEVFHKILEAINDPRTSATYIAELVSKDTNLSARLLRIVNSPFYGFTERVSTLSRALALVGTEKLTQLVLGISAVDAYKDVDPEVLDLYAFWQHSVTCALAASALASEMGLEDEERFFVAGLLHDIGRIAMCKLHPEAARSVTKSLAGARVQPFQMELRCWGFTHARLGGELVRRWNLPDVLRRGVEDHHSPKASGMALEAALIHVADLLAHAMDKRPAPRRPVPRLDQEAWDVLNMPKNVLSRVVTQVDGQLQDIMKVFFNGQ